ncbi:hypothetical protein JB92DRAFT_2826299 [Gautieria morchelliformis]|nr:hypothetical protein JB92DRAFT_2826299 [Gautieria morchelliformis]
MGSPALAIGRPSPWQHKSPGPLLKISRAVLALASAASRRPDKLEAGEALVEQYGERDVISTGKSWVTESHLLWNTGYIPHRTYAHTEPEDMPQKINKPGRVEFDSGIHQLTDGPVNSLATFQITKKYTCRLTR